MRNAFLGSNTPDGFFSYYRNILRMGEGNRLFILKGGSGTGKSTLMKKVAEFADSMGLESELYHCSSDISSLDGVFVPKLKAAVVDGTSPHIMDVTAYGAYEEIVNLGEHVDRSKVVGSTDTIASLLSHKADCYATAYSYIGAAGALYRDVVSKYAAVTDEVKLNGVVYDVVGKLDLIRKPAGTPYGARRKLFLTALTPSGYVDYTEELLNAKQVIVLEHGFDSVAGKVLEKVADVMNLYGYALEYYCSPLAVTMPLSIYCKETDTAVVSKSFLSSIKLSGTARADLDVCIGTDRLARDVIKQDMNEAMILLTFGYERMGKAASYHQELERIYKPSVNFTGVNGKLNYIIEEMQK